MKDVFPSISTSVLPLRSYVISPRIELMIESFGEHLEGLSKPNKWNLVGALALTIEGRTNPRWKGDMSAYDVDDACLDHQISLPELYELDLSACFCQMALGEMEALCEFLVLDLNQTQVL